MAFDSSIIDNNIAQTWDVPLELGLERHPIHAYVKIIGFERRRLVHGCQLLVDELDFAAAPVGADFSLPSVISTLAHTTCGDRANRGRPATVYENALGSRFATRGIVGDTKEEEFTPAGGGTDDGRTLAHVTVAHATDPRIKELLYEGNPQSFILYNFDIQTHVGVGRAAELGDIVVGKSRESQFRNPRAACGAIVATLSSFDGDNRDHVRLREALGEDNYRLLSSDGVRSEKGVDITCAVAASIVALKGMHETMDGLLNELDERGVAHLTASMAINTGTREDTVMQLARATIFNGNITFQGLGSVAERYTGSFVDHGGHADDKRLQLQYGDAPKDGLPIIDGFSSDPVD